MNNKHQENGALRGPLIFTLPASGFVVILSFDWLDRTDRKAVSAKTHGWNYRSGRRGVDSSGGTIVGDEPFISIDFGDALYAKQQR